MANICLLFQVKISLREKNEHLFVCVWCFADLHPSCGLQSLFTLSFHPKNISCIIWFWEIYFVPEWEWCKSTGSYILHRRSANICLLSVLCETEKFHNRQKIRTFFARVWYFADLHPGCGFQSLFILSFEPKNVSCIIWFKAIYFVPEFVSSEIIIGV